MASHDTSVSSIRLFLVDDEPVVRKGLRLLLGQEAGWEVCGEAGTEEDALAGIIAQQPDVAIVDLSLKEGDGLSLIRRLHQRGAAPRILVFSMHEQEAFAASAFAAGAQGYILKEEGAEQVLRAIEAILQEKSYLSKHIAAKAPQLARRISSSP